MNYEENKEISVIIVNWNSGKLIIQCLNSIFTTCKLDLLKIIVIDNASTDKSNDEIEVKFPHIKLIRNKENLGFAKANNIGIKESKTNFICLVNSDIEIINDPFPKMLSYMKKNPKIGILGPKLLWADLSLQPSCKDYPNLWKCLCTTIGLSRLFSDSKLFSSDHMRYFNHNMIKKVPSLAGAFLMVRTESINQVGLLDEKFFMYGEETDWCKRFSENGWDIIFYPDTKVIHYGEGSSSRDHVRFFKEKYKSRLYFWKKHYGFFPVIGFRIIMASGQLLRIIQIIFLFILKPSSRNELILNLKAHLNVLKLLLGFHK